MSLLNFAREDTNDILTDAEGFTTSIVFLAPDTSTATIKGLAIKHHLKFNEFGTPVSSKTARITVSEAALLAEDYPVRNDTDEVALTGHKVTWADSTGTEWTYVIEVAMPDETLGCILCTISDYQA